MNDRHPARSALRTRTAQWHARVDALYSRADLTDAAGYGAFLLAQAAAFIPVEQALEAGGIERVLDDWRSRRRGWLIARDLAELGLPVPVAAQPRFDRVPALLGATYVLEGSRLGGALLRKSVPDTMPRAFLSSNVPGAWPALLHVLDAELQVENDITVAVSAACDVFALFEASGARMIGKDDIVAAIG